MDERIRLRLDVAYDGTDFSGWAAQPGRRTVAGVLAETLDLVLGAGAATGLTVAGRTDAGVHATGQVCHVDLPADRCGARSGGTLVRRLAGLLPADVRVRAVTEVPAELRRPVLGDCSAATSTGSPTPPWGAEPLRRRDTLAWPRPLDLAALNAAAAGLVGEHDFAAYCRRKENATTHPRGDPAGLAPRPGRHPGRHRRRPTRSARRWCAAWSARCWSVGDGRRPVDVAGARCSTRRERANEVTVAAGARADPGRGRLPGRPGRVRPPRRPDPPAAGAGGV